MATQQLEGGVPFAIARQMQQFRLLELPQEIVDLIEAPNPPALSIKSRAPSSSSTTDPRAAYAVLCTPDKTFQLRQVQTSNSLFVTQPALEAHSNDIPVPLTRAIASCANTLELHPSDSSPIAYLDEVLPLYDLVDGDVDAAGNGKSQHSIFVHMPFSDGQCGQAWRDTMAFEFAGSSYRPSINTLTQVWKSINAAAMAEGVKLDQQFLTDDISTTVAEEGHPATLVVAILRHLSSQDQDPTGPWSCLDRVRTVRFVGKALLEAKSEGPDYLTADFLDTWKDNVPESWRNDAELRTIDGVFDLPSKTTISVKGRSTTANKVESAKPRPSSSSRKWHERFGRARQR